MRIMGHGYFEPAFWTACTAPVFCQFGTETLTNGPKSCQPRLIATADATYPLNSRLSLGVSFWYERYSVEDFTLDIDANPDLARGSALLLGYMYRPYNAKTVWFRLIAHW